MRQALFCVCLLVGSLSATQTFAEEAVNAANPEADGEAAVQADYCPYFGEWNYTPDYSCDLEEPYYDMTAGVTDEEAVGDVTTCEAKELVEAAIEAESIDGEIAEEEYYDFWCDGETGRHYKYEFEAVSEATEDAVQVEAVAAEEMSADEYVRQFAGHCWDFACEAYHVAEVAASEQDETSSRREPAADTHEETVAENVAEPASDVADWEAELDSYCDAGMIEAIEVVDVPACDWEVELDSYCDADMVEAIEVADVPTYDWEAEFDAFCEAELAEAAEAALAEQLAQVSEPPQPPALDEDLSEKPKREQPPAADREAILALARTLDQVGGMLQGFSRQLNQMAAAEVAAAPTEDAGVQR